MNTPEAQQAAYGTAERVQQAIDAATAKLKEELAIIKECYQKGLSYDAYNIAIAHQQPSAAQQQFVHIERYFPKGYNPNDEPWLSIRKHCRISEKQMAVLERMLSDKDKEWEAQPDPRQPNATTPEEAPYSCPIPPDSPPTPDMEKLEWKLWSRGDNRVTIVQNNEIESIITPEPVSSEQGELLRKKHNEALIQARAPLVKDKERLDWLDKHFCVQFGNLVQRKNIAEFSPFKDKNKTVRQCIDAVLTGTGRNLYDRC